MNIIHGDSKDALKDLPDDSVDLVCTDPPYGYSFMGKSWDKTLPDIAIFKECHRVLKPGAFAFVMSAPRSDVCARMMLMLEDAGFEIGFTPIYWTYASGFPKAAHIGKMVDKRLGVERSVIGMRPAGKGIASGAQNYGGGASVYAQANPITRGTSPLEGSYGGFQPKPAVEVVIVAMKPLSEKTFVDQALKNGKGVTWLDDCRVPTKPRKTGTKAHGDEATGSGSSLTGSSLTRQQLYDLEDKGRFPANLLVSDDVLNDGTIQKSGTAIRKNIGISQSGERYGGYTGDGAAEIKADLGYADQGSYSRYFDLDAWAKTFPFLIVPKAAKSEKNQGLEDFEDKQTTYGSGGGAMPSGNSNAIKTTTKNAHPTVKPLKLMSYLITLGSRPGDVVLDPFLGSGTTAIAAKQLGRKCIGIEREAEYVEIAKARLAATAEPAPKLFDV